jgi:DNA helicase-2/ATP-dependent DNA helicase PcrA
MHQLILSGPGTGKTTHLIKSVAEFIKENPLSRKNILVLTFTRSAAQELKQKLISDPDIGEENLPLAMTLHAFSLMILMSDTYRSRIGSPVRILDEWETNKLLIPCLESLNEYTGRDRKKRIKEKLKIYEAGWNSLSFDYREWVMKNDPEFYNTIEILRNIFGFVLVGELPYKFRDFLKSDPHALGQRDIKFVFVDEYQDLNPCDQDIVYLLSQREASLYIYGDDDQSIYSFRKAAPIGIINFAQRYPESENITLDTCYRCPGPILKLSQDMIIRTTAPRVQKDIVAHIEGPAIIKCYTFDNGGAETRGIINELVRLNQEDLYQWKDILILVPTKKLGNYLARGISEQQIPLENWLKRNSPLDNKEIRKSYAVLRFAIDESDSIALWTWLLLYRGISFNTMISLMKICRVKSLNFYSLIEKIINNDIDVENRIKTIVKKAYEELKRISTVLSSNYEGLMNWFMDMLENIENEDRDWANRLFSEIFTQEAEEEGHSLKEVLSKIQTLEIKPEIEPVENKVRLMTMHKAKGLSSKVVFLPFMEDEVVLQHADSEAKIEECRRLIYVSVTRARERLYITYSRSRIDNLAYTSSGRARERRRLIFFNDTDIICENGNSLLL